MGSYVEKSAISAQSSQWNDVSSRIPWSALSGDGTKITGISSSAIGGTDYSAGEYVSITGDTISVTGLQPVSAMSSYVEKTAFDACCTAMSGYVSSLSSQVSSISSTVSGLTGTYVEISSISGYSSIWNSASAVPGKLDESAFTAYTSTAREFTGVTTDSTLTGNGTSGSALGVNKMELVFDSSMSTSISGNSAIVGVNSAIMSGKLDNSASSTWYPYTGNPSGFLTAHQDLSGYVEKSAISAQSSQWNEVSGLSGKLDNSASSTWYPWAGNPSGFLTAHQELTGYVEKSSISAESSNWNEVSAMMPWSALSGDGTSITGISGSSIKGHEYTGIAPIVVDNTAETIAVNYSGLALDSSMSATASGGDIVIGVAGGIFLAASALGTGVI
jgi:hypothetical protein